jgi:energy-converting hydrogenase Eha subunit H
MVVKFTMKVTDMNMVMVIIIVIDLMIIIINKMNSQKLIKQMNLQKKRKK